MEQKTFELFRVILGKLKPTEPLCLSEWSDKYRRLAQGTSSEPGRWRTSRTPYLKKIMDSITSDKVRKVVVMSSAQIGKSEILINSIGYYSSHEPSAILMVQPTVQAGKDFSKERIEPTINETPILREVIGVSKNKDSKNTILKKFFPGGFFAIVGANSPAGLASRPIRILLADEIDRWTESAEDEGDPLTIAEKRTITYEYICKLIYTSTPTIDQVSRIQHEFKQGSQEEWELPCPGCGKYQKIEWANIIFHYDKKTKKLDDSEEVMCCCSSCGELHNEYAWKSGEGKWVPQNDNSVIKSFHLSALVSPWRSWKRIVEAFLAAKDDAEMLKVWTNTELGDVWMEAGTKLDENDIAKHKEIYDCIIPDDVVVLTAGVDVQDDRFEMEVVGWAPGKTTWGIEHKVIYGDTSKDETWKLLDQQLLMAYSYGDGKNMPITRVCIDSGGHRTTECYKFCKEREYRGVFAIKGKGGQGIPMIHSYTKTKKVGNTLFILGVDAIKDTVYSRLAYKDESIEGYCHFPMEDSRHYNEQYFKGLTAEIRITKMVKGRPVIEWIKKAGHNNEPLDCRVYATAAFEILNPNLELLKQRKDAKPSAKKRRRGTVSKGVNIDE